MAGFDNKRSVHDGADHLSGKRGAPRRPRSLFVTCRGAGGQVQGRTVDLSRGGMLLEIRDRQYLPSDQPSGIIPFAARIADLFPEGMEAVFGDGAVKVHAAVVRVASHPTDPAAMRLGCRFDEPLADGQCHLLGLDVSAIPDPALEVPADDLGAAKAAAAGSREKRVEAAHKAETPKKVETSKGRPGVETPIAVPRAQPVPAAATRAPDDPEWGDELARIGRRNAASMPRPRPMKVARGTILVHLFSHSGPLMGPRFVGTLTDVKGRSLVADFSTPEGEGDPVAYAAVLGTGARAVFLRDGRVLWDVQARVDFVEAAGAAEDVARVTLVTTRVPPASLRRVSAATVAQSVTPAA